MSSFRSVLIPLFSRDIEAYIHMHELGNTLDKGKARDRQGYGLAHAFASVQCIAKFVHV